MYIKVSFKILSWQLYDLDICVTIKSLSIATIDQLIVNFILQFNGHNICTTVITETIMLVSGHLDRIYRQVSNIRGTKFINLNVSCLVLQLSLHNLLKPCVKSRIKM